MENLVELQVNLALMGILTPIVIGVVEAFKRTERVPRALLPFLSIGLGIVGYVAIGSDAMAIEVLAGIMIGLTASGLYAGTKAAAGK